MPRNTPGRPWPPASAPAWGNTFPTASFGRAAATAGSRTPRWRRMSEKRMHGLYAVTPEDYLLPRLSALVEMALQGGARYVQYRNKLAPRPLRRAHAAELLRISRAHGARLIVNDDLDLALAVGADGVHLGRDDVPGG